MTDIPADAPRSEDGNYWWDGSAWQAVTPDAGGQTAPTTGAAGIPADAPRSEDGNYWWDGTAWEAVAQGAGGQGAPAPADGAQAAAPGDGQVGPLEHTWGASLLTEIEVPEIQDDGTAGEEQA